MPYENVKDAHAKVDNPNLGKQIKFPRMVYHEDGGLPKRAENQSQLDKLVAEGWSETPIPGHECDPEGRYHPPVSAPEPRAIGQEVQPADAPRGPGRPKKMAQTA